MRNLYLLLSVLIAYTLVYVEPATPRKEGPKMLCQGFLNLEDDAFWCPGPNLSSAADRLLDDDMFGLALDAPRHPVDIRTRATLPLAAIGVAILPKARDWALHEHTLLVAGEIEQLRSYVAMAAPIERPILRGPPRGNSVPEAEAEGAFAESALIEARSRLGLPWEPATYRMVLLSRDLMSNPVHVRLIDGNAPAQSLETSEPLPHSGMTLTTTGTDKATVLQVTFKVRARRDALPSLDAGGKKQVMVPLTFLATGHEQPLPYVHEVMAADASESDGGPPDHVHGTHEVAFATIAPHAPPDTYYLYALAGEELSKPARIQVTGQ